jgi:hypothetical protein
MGWPCGQLRAAGQRYRVRYAKFSRRAAPASPTSRSDNFARGYLLDATLLNFALEASEAAASSRRLQAPMAPTDRVEHLKSVFDATIQEQVESLLVSQGVIRANQLNFGACSSSWPVDDDPTRSHYRGSPGRHPSSPDGERYKG